MTTIRELRKKANMTMKELGAQLGVAESTISQYETGKRQPDYETLLRIGKFFGVSVDYLITGENKTTVLPETQARTVTDDDIMFALWGDASDIDKRDLDDVKRYAAFIRERKNRND